MNNNIPIKSALISVFNKEALYPVIQKLNELGVKIYSTGGTEKFIKKSKIKVFSVENLTSFPSILDGRVKTLHPKVFGGILNRQNNKNDQKELSKFNIPQIDLVIVDLYPFKKTLESNACEQEIIEKIDIGGISLIRAAAKNYNDTFVVSSIEQYDEFLKIISKKNGQTSINERKKFATKAFNISSDYDTAIFNYFNDNGNELVYKLSETNSKTLRYGENHHQKGIFFGNLNSIFDQLHGKELSYNNLLDLDSAINLMNEFKNDEPTFGILKHNNACGFAQRKIVFNAYIDALAGDPVSAFGGVLISNSNVDKITAQEINKLFCEIVIAPRFDNDSLEILKSKKNRIILSQKDFNLKRKTIRTALNGFLVQDRNNKTDSLSDLRYPTEKKPSQTELNDLLFASKICKHTKSNTIVLVKNKQLYAIGTGQTSRVDALNQAINKATCLGFDLNGAVMASDAFFPFPDCVEIAYNSGIKSIIQPGGSIKDKLSINFCNNKNLAMVFTGTRHFKH